MRGLPPVPDDVLRLTVDVDINGRVFSTGFWFFVPDLPAATYPWFKNFVDEFFFYVIGGLNGCQHAGASVTTCRLVAGGIGGVQYTAFAATNQGVYTGGQADLVAAGVFLRTAAGRRGSGSRVRIPGCPDAFVDNNLTLSAAAVARLFSFCDAVNNFVSAQLGPTGAQVVVGTLRRTQAAAPLSSSVFDPAVAIMPSPRVEYLTRRFPRTRWVSPF